MRSIIGVIAYISFVVAIPRLPLGLLSTIDKTGPMWAAIIGATFLKERLSLIEWGIMTCSFIGVILIAATGKEDTESYDYYIGIICMSTTVLGNAVIAVLTRKMQTLHYSLVLANY